ncbi:MAG: DUF58 domain-containing protein [Sphingomonadales bacterium]|nr:DUF58 domain-containing protein [Sphingomonadales bacterium]
MMPRAALIPTGRAALLVAAAAPLALLVAVLVPAMWAAAPALGTLILVLVLVDAVLAGGLRALTLTSDPDLEVGEPGLLQIDAEFASGMTGSAQCAIAADLRLLPGGRTEGPLARVEPARWRAALPFTPTRRGTGQIETIWLRWTGPLGLGARQVVQDLDRPVRVWPNLAPVRSPALQTFLRDAQFGLIARRMRGEGTMFESLAEFEPGMDRRRIDWKASARHAHLYAKEYEAERNNQIVFAFDCGAAMSEPVGGLPRIDRAVSAALATAFVALKGGDRVALYGFAARPELFTPFAVDPRDFARLSRAAAALDYHAQEPNFTLALASLASRLKRRSLIVVFSDFTDPTSAELMVESISRLTARHLVLFVTMADEELTTIATATPDDMQQLAMAVSADGLLRQRALVLGKLRQLGVDVIEASWDRIGTRLLDSYLAIKRKGAIG